MLPMSPSRLEQHSADFTLRLHAVGLTDLGPYTCQAYNGMGAPASFTVVARALGPVNAATPEEQQYMAYVDDSIRPPERQPVQPVRPPVLGPQGVYRYVGIIFHHFGH